MVPLGHESCVCGEERRCVLKSDSCFKAVLALGCLNTCKNGLAKPGQVFCSVTHDKQGDEKHRLDNRTFLSCKVLSLPMLSVWLLACL